MKSSSNTCASYRITELSETAQDNAYRAWREDSEAVAWVDDDARESLEKFSQAFEVEVKRGWVSKHHRMTHWQVNVINKTLADRKTPLSGIRLAKYLWNNYANNILRGKTYQRWSIKYETIPYSIANGFMPSKRNRFAELKKRTSKIIVKLGDCPFTGTCYDDYLLRHIVACLHYKETYGSYEELINSCIQEFIERSALNYGNASKEHFIALATRRGYKYNKNGKQEQGA